MWHKSKQNGFSLVELLLAIGISILVLGLLAFFVRDTFSFYNRSTNIIALEREERTFLTTVERELRMAQISDGGAYPIESASSTELVFYSDLYGNSKRERVRYTVSGSKLVKGVVVSSGVPPVYPTSAEQVTTPLTHLVGTSTPFFSYFPLGFAPTLAPLTDPMDVKLVRLVQINVVEAMTDRGNVSSINNSLDVTLRNLH